MDSLCLLSIQCVFELFSSLNQRHGRSVSENAMPPFSSFFLTALHPDPNVNRSPALQAPQHKKLCEFGRSEDVGG